MSGSIRCGQPSIWNWTNRVSSSHPADWERWDSDFRPQSEQNCKSKETGRVYHGRWRISDEYSGDGNGGNTGTGITICLLNNNYLGMVRQMQELFYGKRYSATCLRRRPSCPGGCKGPNDQCPEYVPDFVKLAESYGAYGIRVEKEEDIDAAFAEAKKHTDAPTIIEFMIATDELVLPMVKSGNPMSEMILK